MQLADTSAWVWTRAVGGRLRAEFDEAVVAGMIATCAMVRLKLLYSAQNADEFTDLHADPGALPISRSTELMGSRTGGVCAPRAAGRDASSISKHPDLLIAAGAEAAGVEILHYDEDYDRIAAITGQPIRWLAPRGSLP